MNDYRRGGTVSMKSLITAAAVVTLIGAVVPWSLSAQHTGTSYQPPETSTSIEVVPATPVETTTTKKVEVKKIKPRVTEIKTRRHTTTVTAPEESVESGTTAPGPTTTAAPAPPPVVETTAPPAPAPAPPIVYSPPPAPAPAPEMPVATAGEAPAPE